MSKYTDIELSFLEYQGINYNENGDFFETGFNALEDDGRYGDMRVIPRNMRSFGSKGRFTTLEYSGKATFECFSGKSKKRTITFVRGNQVGSDKVPSVILENSDVKVAFGAKTPNSKIYLGKEEEITDEIKNILDNVRDITVQVRLKNGRKTDFIMEISVNNSTGQTYTSLWRNANQVCLIEGFLSCITCIMNGKSRKEKTFDDICSCVYDEILSEAIDEVYSDEPIVVERLQRLTPLLVKTYGAALLLPSINESALRAGYQADREAVEKHYDSQIAILKRDERERLDKIDDNVRKLDNIIAQYSISEEAKK